MMRVALHSELRAGSIDAYRIRHESIPRELAETFSRVGIRDWVIWRSGHRLFHIVDCEDWDHAVQALAHDKANLAWQADIGRYVETFRDQEGGAAFDALEPIWSLATQVGDTPGQ